MGAAPLPAGAYTCPAIANRAPSGPCRQHPGPAALMATRRRRPAVIEEQVEAEVPISDGHALLPGKLLRGLQEMAVRS